MESRLNDKVGQVKLVGQPNFWFERWLVWAYKCSSMSVGC